MVLLVCQTILLPSGPLMLQPTRLAHSDSQMKTHPDLFFQAELTLLQLMPKAVYLSNLVSLSLFISI